jgi:hypothetical protein
MPQIYDMGTTARTKYADINIRCLYTKFHIPSYKQLNINTL